MCLLAGFLPRCRRESWIIVYTEMLTVADRSQDFTVGAVVSKGEVSCRCIMLVRPYSRLKARLNRDCDRIAAVTWRAGVVSWPTQTDTPHEFRVLRDFPAHCQDRKAPSPVSIVPSLSSSGAQMLVAWRQTNGTPPVCQ